MARRVHVEQLVLSMKTSTIKSRGPRSQRMRVGHCGTSKCSFNDIRTIVRGFAANAMNECGESSANTTLNCITFVSLASTS